MADELAVDDGVIPAGISPAMWLGGCVLGGLVMAGALIWWDKRKGCNCHDEPADVGEHQAAPAGEWRDLAPERETVGPLESDVDDELRAPIGAVVTDQCSDACSEAHTYELGCQLAAPMGVVGWLGARANGHG